MYLGEGQVKHPSVCYDAKGPIHPYDCLDVDTSSVAVLPITGPSSPGVADGIALQYQRQDETEPTSRVEDYCAPQRESQVQKTTETGPLRWAAAEYLKEEEQKRGFEEGHDQNVERLKDIDPVADTVDPIRFECPDVSSETSINQYVADDNVDGDARKICQDEEKVVPSQQGHRRSYSRS